MSSRRRNRQWKCGKCGRTYERIRPAAWIGGDEHTRERPICPRCQLGLQASNIPKTGRPK